MAATRLLYVMDPMCSWCWGFAPVVEALAADKLPARAPIRLRASRVRRVLGIDLSADAVAGMFERLDLQVSREGDDFIVTPPSYRFDVEIEEDLIEEIARIHGYDNIPSHAPRGPITMLPRPEAKRDTMSLRRQVAAREYQEVINFAFVEEAWEKDFAGNTNPVRLANPIASQMSVMRSTLIGGLVDTLVGNLNRKQPRVRVFEIARVFRKEADGSVAQPERLAGLAGIPVRYLGWLENGEVQAALPTWGRHSCAAPASCEAAATWRNHGEALTGHRAICGRLTALA